MTAEPFAAEDREVFRRFAADKLRTEMYEPLGDTPADPTGIYRMSLESVRDYMRPRFGLVDAAGTPFRVYPSFVETFSANAFADRAAGIHLCGIHSALAGGLAELALFCFSQGRFFMEAGDPSVETSPRVPQGSTLAFWLADLTAEKGTTDLGPEGADFAPKDRLRHLLAVYLCHLLIRFAWFHELYHCLNGHIDYLKTIDAGARLHEMPGDSLHGPLGMVGYAEEETVLTAEELAHAQELDADKSAFMAMAEVQINGQENIGEFGRLPLAFRLKLTLFAALIMTYVFEEYAKRLGRDSAPGSHPDASVRLHNLFRSAASNLQPLVPDLPVILKGVLSEILQLRERVPQLFDPNQLIADLRSKEVEERMNKHGADIIEARQAWSPYAFHAPGS